MLSSTQKQTCIKDNNRCWRCGRGHQAAECNLKMRCKTCSNRHLLVLHDINEWATAGREQAGGKPERMKAPLNSPTEEILYIDRPLEGRKVLLKVSKVVLRNGDRTMDAYAILDDGSERTILLQPAAQQLTRRPPLKNSQTRAADSTWRHGLLHHFPSSRTTPCFLCPLSIYCKTPRAS